MMFQKYIMFLASGRERSSSRGWKVNRQVCRACTDLLSATTGDTSHTGCGPDHLQYTHNWLLVVCEGKPSSHPTWTHMSQMQRANKAYRPQRDKEALLWQHGRKHL